jgi:hypothetical protein
MRLSEILYLILLSALGTCLVLLTLSRYILPIRMLTAGMMHDLIPSLWDRR